MAQGLTIEERRYLNRLVANLISTHGSLVLVGSRARGASRADSDIDLLILSSGAPPPAPGRLQLIKSSEQDLRSRLARGDDFAAWVLRFGKPIQGRRTWERLQRQLSAVERWPDAESKYEKARRHQQAAVELAEMGDEDAAAEEAVLALSHLARAKLIEGQVFPLSRPELAGQLRSLGEDEIANAMESDGGEAGVMLSALERNLPTVP